MEKSKLIFTLLSIAFIGGCSTMPIVDSRGKSSANIQGDMNRFHDDYYTCKKLGRRPDKLRLG